MKTPFLDKPCPRDERLACKDCGWFIKSKWMCKLGYRRECSEPDKLPGVKKEPKSRW